MIASRLFVDPFVGFVSHLENNYMIPQLIYVALAFIGLGINIAQHGKPKTGKHDAWVSLISAAIEAYILYAGGFFNPLLNS